MKRYSIWNKKDNILTPVGEVLTPEQWIERRPIAGVESITVVCSAGEINGAFFGTLGAMVQTYEKEGADFSACTTPEEKLAVIEAFEDERDKMKTRTKCLRRWTWVSCGQEVDRFVTEKEKGGRDGCR